MTRTHSADDIGALIRRRGLPERPVAEVQVSEIRSDQFLNQIKTLEPEQSDLALGALVIEWGFRVPYEKITGLHAFLAENEAFIAAGCRSQMKGVAYRGTYVGAAGQRGLYRTVWAYESWEAHGEWAKVVGGDSQFVGMIQTLRGYWLADPHSTQEHFAFAAAVDPEAHPFLSLTIRTAVENAAR